MTLRIASWNINSVRLRLALVERLLKEQAPDVLALQEIKCDSELFPREAFAALGYGHAIVHGQAGYHGVAIVSRLPIVEVGRHDFNATGQARHIGVRVKTAAKTAGPIVDTFYVPSGGDEPDPETNPKFRQKLEFLAALTDWSAKLEPGARIAVGDFNVAPLENDVWSHKQLLGIVSHTPGEVESLTRAQKAGGWSDVMRAFVPPDQKLYSWWSYRAKDWRASNRGRRLDHIWARGGLAGKATAMCVLDEARGWPQPSDHVPVLADFEL